MPDLAHTGVFDMKDNQNNNNDKNLEDTIRHSTSAVIPEAHKGVTTNWRITARLTELLALLL